MGMNNENAKSFEQMHAEMERTTPETETGVENSETVTEEVTEDVVDEATDNVETEKTSE